MIRQQVGDVLEISFENNWYYIVILTKAIMFGGNIIFAYHNDGKKIQLEEVKELKEGFNICTDILWFKKQGWVSRIGKLDNLEGLFKTRYMKGCHEIKQGEKAKRWFIYDIDELQSHIAVVTQLPNNYKTAMDYATFSFDLVIEKILKRYTPDQNEHI